jgi:hypothetical protein
MDWKRFILRNAKPEGLNVICKLWTNAWVASTGVEDELDTYAGHEVLRAILDQGCDPKEYGRHYEARLRQAELESIQDYLSESDNLVMLHQQASVQ